MSLEMIPAGLEAFTAANTAASGLISAAASADTSAMTSAAATAVGPIGAVYLAAYAPAQASNLACTLMVGAVHTGIGGATEASKVGYLATDSTDL